jgi:HTH-type transcriptional regulator, transcriptional repressor of NAD biosynthesis genes
MNAKPFRHGLVIGKFYPPHLGHIHAMQTALERCERVSVEVLYSSVESIPGPLRADWIRQCFPDDSPLRVLHDLDDVPVDYENPAIWDAHVQIMKDLLKNEDKEASIGDPWPMVDAVFTSELYGEELARRFEAKAVLVDLERDHFPVSGTAVRENPAECWTLLPRPVRAGLARRVVVLGAESTGTTTLSLDLTQALRERGDIWTSTSWVPEYGREYSARLQEKQREAAASTAPSDFNWTEQDFLEIAAEQNRLEELGAASGSPILVCDTDSLATCIWHERYRGHANPRLETTARELPPRALYLLTSHEEVPFEDDGLRDRPHLRPAMTERFRVILASQPAPWIEVAGSREHRLKMALEAVDRDYKSAFRFNTPLG